MSFSRTKQQQHKIKRDIAPYLLEKANITFLSKNNGAHLIIESLSNPPFESINFWPGTGLWRSNSLEVEGKDIGPLITYLQKKAL